MTTGVELRENRREAQWKREESADGSGQQYHPLHSRTVNLPAATGPESAALESDFLVTVSTAIHSPSR